MYSEAVKKNYVIHYHLMSVYYVLLKIIWVFTKMQIFNFMKHIPISTTFPRQSSFTTLWLSGPSNCCWARSTTANSWHFEVVSSTYRAFIIYHQYPITPKYPKNFQTSGPKSYTFFCCLIVSYSPLYTKRHTVNIFITGWKSI